MGRNTTSYGEKFITDVMDVLNTLYLASRLHCTLLVAGRDVKGLGGFFLT